AVAREAAVAVERALRVAVVVRPELAADVVLLEAGADGVEVVVTATAAGDRAVRGVAIQLARRGGGGRRLIDVDVRGRRRDDVTEQARLHEDLALGGGGVREFAARGEHRAVREDA